MMSGMTEGRREWEAWFDAFTRIRDAWPTKISVSCPGCGEGSVQVSYTGDPETRIGYAIAWCESCKRGIYLSRVAIPPGAEMLTFDATDQERDAAVPPDVYLLSPDPGSDDSDDVEVV